MPQLSFVMPTKNRAHLLPQSLDAIKAQTMSDWELVIIDDGSEDNTAELVASYNDSRFRYYKLPLDRGHGIACARNTGNQLAKSELIAVIDSDDLCMPHRAEQIVASHKERKWDVYASAGIYRDLQSGQEITPKFQTDHWQPEVVKEKNYIIHSSMAYTRTIASQFPYNSAYPSIDDYELLSRLIEAGVEIYYDPEPTVIYRQHENNISSQTKRAQRSALLRNVRSLRGWTNEPLEFEEIIS